MPSDQSHKRLVVLTGASGSGKTTLAAHCSGLGLKSLSIFHSDDMAVPSVEQMISECGSTEEWRRERTFDWFERLAANKETRILFEGQSRFAFIEAAAAKFGLSDVRIILVDCDDETRIHRLIVDREQPELAGKSMLAWASYLRSEAIQRDCQIIDTSRSTVEKCAEAIMQCFG